MFKIIRRKSNDILEIKEWYKCIELLSTIALDNKEKSQYTSNDPIYNLAFDDAEEADEGGGGGGGEKFMPLDAAFSINQKLKYEKKKIPIKYIPFEEIRPDFQNTNLGSKLMHYGNINEEVLYNIAEKNSSAFQKTNGEIDEIENKLKTKLEVTNEELLNIIIKNPYIITEETPNLENTLNVIQIRLEMETKEIKEIILKHPLILKDCHKFEEQFENAASVLYEKMKVTMHDLKGICMRYPLFLTEMHENRIEELSEFFVKHLKMSPIQVGEMYKECPGLISRSVEGIEERYKFLLEYGFLKHDIRSMISRYAKLLNLNLESQIKHVSRYLEVTLNFQRLNVRKLIYPYPYILEFDTEYRIAPVIAILSNFKFDQEEIGLMFIRCPSLVAIEMTQEDIDLKISYLKNKLNKRLQDLIIYPNYLVVSYEKLILPRIAFLESIKQKSYKEWPLMKLFGDRDDEFCIRHAKVPYSKYTDFLNTYHKVEQY